MCFNCRARQMCRQNWLIFKLSKLLILQVQQQEQDDESSPVESYNKVFNKKLRFKFTN